MSMRTFRAPDQSNWTVWRVEAASSVIVPGTPSVWLAFQNEDGTERRRLVEFPEDWPQLSDQLLDLLRRMATPAGSPQRSSAPRGFPQLDAETESEPRE
jgi:hypothetical protein